MKKILISVVMPTYNSEKTIALALQSIRDQTFPQDQIEILVIDGGSTDKTLKIAKKYKCSIFKNPDTQQEYAKYIGLLNAKGRCVMFLDSDEILQNRLSFKLKSNLIFKNISQIVFSGGYKSITSDSFVNEYINTFGDPFAFFMYEISANESMYIEDVKNKYRNTQYQDYLLFRISKNQYLPLIDLCAGTVIDKKFIMENKEEVLSDVKSIPKLTYSILEKTKMFSILNNDGIFHYSVDSLDKYLNKLRWRIIVNIFYKSIPGTGYSNRESYQPIYFQLKKYLFLPYAISLFFPLFTAVKFILKTRKLSPLLHPIFSIYVALNIIFYTLIKFVGFVPPMTIYGGVHKSKN